jgi:hypothetical protein
VSSDPPTPKIQQIPQFAKTFQAAIVSGGLIFRI